MPPALLRSDLNLVSSIVPRELSEAGIFRSQWSNPNDILSLLLLIGPDIVQRAIAQLSGNIVVPVAFSFGWVSYSLNALLAVIGGGKLMPEADFPCLVIGAKSGHVRNNKSWILGRLLRDLEKDTDDQLANLEAAHEAETRRSAVRAANAPHSWEALRVCVYSFKDSENVKHGSPRIDWLWFMGTFVVTLQLAIAIIPWIFYGAWGTFVITIGGTSLATLTSSLPQWRLEKWACPQTSTTVTITRGNGSRHAVVIVGARHVGLDLEVLATGTRTEQFKRSTKLLTPLFAVMWIVLLICVAGMNDHSWYLLGIGTLGMLQNVVAAGANRRPEALGIQIKLKEVVTGSKVQEVLRKVEEKYPLVGTSLLPVFFPGTMRVKDDQVTFWKEAMDKRMAPNEFGVRVDTLPLAGTAPNAAFDVRNDTTLVEKSNANI